jgi:integrase/recombinase XerD
VTSDLQDRFYQVLLSLDNNDNDNGTVIAQFLTSLNTEINLSKLYRMTIIDVLSMLSKFLSSNRKKFKEMIREDILSFLNSRRKTEEADPLHKWIGTYNNYRRILVRFFRWLYYPDIQRDKRPKPACIENIPKLGRREESIYKPTDLWTPQEDILFLKYCPSKRMKCYHMMSRDLSARPHEILKLKIKDVVFRSQNGRQYAQVTVNGKTGNRNLPLFNSLPYLKDYLSSEHPFPGNPNSPLICGESKSLGRAISTKSLFRIYRTYKQELYPKLLNSPAVLPEDKPKIAELLKKPWNPYVVGRHTSLTAKAKILKEPILKMHAGWRANSQMHLRYEHWFGDEHNKVLLEEMGVLPKDEFTDDLLLLKPKQCPNCNEPNKIDSRFCTECRMILTYDAYNETVTMNQKYEQELQQMKEKLNSVSKLQEQFDKLNKKLGLV